jgi:hypothetical protein
VKATRVLGLSTAWLAAMLVAGCGEVSRSGRAPVQVVIVTMDAASGAEEDEFGGTLRSDVITLVERQVNGQTVQVPTVFDDVGRVTMRLILKDPGEPGSPAAPSELNTVTFSRYRVTYRRTDGRNTQGVDVPYAFDSAVTFTIPTNGDASAGFTLVRHTAKMEAPLQVLVSSSVIISTIADVTFYGRDQAGNDVTATASLGVFFGNFGDPQ